MPPHEHWLNVFPLFHLLDEDESTTLAALLEKKNVRADEILFNFGDKGDSLYLVQNGQIELFIKDHTGEKIVLKVAGPNSLFGELSLLDNGPRTASAQALEDSELFVLGQDDLLQFLRKKPDAALDLLAVLGGQIRETNSLVRGRVSRNTNQQIEEKLTWGQRLANWIANFSGSMPFLFINGTLFAGWILINIGLIPSIKPFDPYPFGFLTMAVSLEAIFLSIFVLLAQSLQAAKDKIRGDTEYEVNLKAELEIAQLHEKVDRINEVMLKRFYDLEKTRP